MPAKKSPAKSSKKTAAKSTSSTKSLTKEQAQLAASVGPLLMVIGVLGLLCLLLGFYITLAS